MTSVKLFPTLNGNQFKLTVMKTISTILLAIATVTITAQENLEGVWFEGDNETSQTLKFRDDGVVIIHEVDQLNHTTISEGHYYYEAGSDLLVIIRWHGDQASTTKYHFNATDENLELSQFYPIESSRFFDRGPRLADL